MSGPVGACVVRPVGEVLRSELERVTLLYPPMAAKIATSKDWDQARNILTVLSDHVRVSNLAFAIVEFFSCIQLSQFF